MSFLNRLRAHPAITSWLILSVCMVIMLVIAAKDVPLLPSQLAAMIVATIVLAGACVWIINWD